MHWLLKERLKSGLTKKYLDRTEVRKKSRDKYSYWTTVTTEKASALVIDPQGVPWSLL